MLISSVAVVSLGLGKAHSSTTPPKTHLEDRRIAASSQPSASGTPLSLDQLAGQRVIYAYSGLQPPPSLLKVIGAGEAAGVILFGPNIANRGQLHAVITQLQRAAAASSVHRKLLILTDQEGGDVRRLPGAPALSEKQIGARPNNAALAQSAGNGAGNNLAGVGVNVNLAPVLDVYRRPGNFIDQYQRSYSSDPTTVSTLGAAFIAAQQQTGVAAAAKHFPGLGSARQAQNTDLQPVSLNVSLPRLRSVDESPYRDAIGAGVKLIMTSWAIYPALDPSRPAGLSSRVIQHELRQALGFRGVTITDDIEAGALTTFGSLAKRSVLAARAGADLILCAALKPEENTPSEGISVMHALAAALASDQLNKSDAGRAAARVLALRAHT